MFAIIRLRGMVKMRKEVLDTFRILSLDTINAMRVMEETPSNKGMLKKVEGFIAWGEVSEETLKKLGGKKVINLKPPKGGFVSIKRKYPNGDIGYRGDKINQLIDRMM